MDKKVNIVIVDDHPILVEGLREIIDHVEDFQVLFTASKGEELLKLLVNSRPDVIIMDINMPGLNGIECTRRVKEKYPEIKIVVLTMHSELVLINQLMNVGADGCLIKSNGSKELIEAIRRVMDNKSYYDNFKDFFNGNPNQLPEIGKLSEREEEIVRLIAKGLTNLEVAEKLFIAENTVKTHRKNILKKLGLTGTSQLALYAISSNLV